MAAADSWDPAQYDRFGGERRQPFDELLALVEPTPGGRAVDLGCGRGDLTVDLHRRLGLSETIGIDRSAAMLAGARDHAVGGVTFRCQDIVDFPAAGDGSFDVIAANASLHWVGNHPALLARLSGALRPRGQLAFQVPANFDHPSHAVAARVAAEPPFAATLTGPAAGAAGQPAALAPEAYASLLYDLGFAEQHVRLQVFGHVLAGTDDVVEWVKGTTLTRFQERLPSDVFEQFVARYRACLLDELGDQRPYFYGFRRILCWARRP